MLPLVNRSRPTKIRHLVWLLAAAAVAGALPTFRGESALGQKVPLASGIPGQQDGNSPQKHEKKSDREMLQGTWTRISIEINGQTQPIDPGKVPDLVIKDDTFAFGGVNENGELLSPEKFKLNPEASPKQIDLTPISSKAGPLKGVTYFGIYKLEDDILTLCLHPRRESERPQKFSSVADTRPVLDVYKRKISSGQPEGQMKKLDRALLQGTWTRISTEMSGQTQPIDPGKVPDLVIKDDTFAFGGVNENGELLSPEKFKLNPESSPKQIDLTPISSKAGPLKGVTFFGIYKLEDDKLTLCLDIRRDSVRPQKFSSVADSRPVLDVYKRKISLDQPEGHKTRLDRALLQGTWTRISTEMSGQTQPIEPGKVPDLVIKDDMFAFGGVDENGELLSPEKFKLNPDASPRQIDLTPTSSKAGPLKGVTYFGIYKLEDDKLTLCLNIRRNGERPQKFSSVADALPVLHVYKRKKSPDQPKPR